jgi:hypothetical protein
MCGARLSFQHKAVSIFSSRLPPSILALQIGVLKQPAIACEPARNLYRVVGDLDDREGKPHFSPVIVEIKQHGPVGLVNDVASIGIPLVPVTGGHAGAPG